MKELIIQKKEKRKFQKLLKKLKSRKFGGQKYGHCQLIKDKKER